MDGDRRGGSLMEDNPELGRVTLLSWRPRQLAPSLRPPDLTATRSAAHPGSQNAKLTSSVCDPAYPVPFDCFAIPPIPRPAYIMSGESESYMSSSASAVDSHLLMILGLRFFGAGDFCGLDGVGKDLLWWNACSIICRPMPSITP